MSDNPVQPVDAAPPATNGLAVAGLVLGCVGAFIGLVPVVGWFLSIPFAVLAIVFGFIGLATSQRLGGLRQKMSIAAVILGFVPTVLFVLLLVIRGVFAAMSN